MAGDKTKLSALRKADKKRAKQQRASDDFTHFRDLFQEMGELLGLDGTFVSHFGTDKLFERLGEIVVQMENLEATLLMLAAHERGASQDLSFLAAIVLGDHFDWKKKRNLEDLNDRLQAR